MKVGIETEQRSLSVQVLLTCLRSGLRKPYIRLMTASSALQRGLVNLNEALLGTTIGGSGVITGVIIGVDY